jgi:hypothetical protein
MLIWAYLFCLAVGTPTWSLVQRSWISKNYANGCNWDWDWSVLFRKVKITRCQPWWPSDVLTRGWPCQKQNKKMRRWWRDQHRGVMCGMHCAAIWGFVYWAKAQVRDGGATGRYSIWYEGATCQVARRAKRNWCDPMRNDVGCYLEEETRRGLKRKLIHQTYTQSACNRKW